MDFSIVASIIVSLISVIGSNSLLCILVLYEMYSTKSSKFEESSLINFMFPFIEDIVPVFYFEIG